MAEENEINEETLELETDDQQQSILDMLGELEPELESEEILDDTEGDEETLEEESPVESEELEETDEPDEVEESTDDEIEPEPDDETELTEVELLQQRNEELLKIIEQGVAASLATPKTSGEPETEETVQVVPPASSAAPTLAELVGEVDFNEMQDNPQLFVELLQRVVDHTRTTTVNSLQTELPRMVTERATQAVSLQTMVDDFYRENGDLSAVKKTVSAVAQNISADHPDWEMAEVLTEAATKTRTLLGLKKPKTTSSKPVRNGKKPAIPNVKGAHKATPKKVSKLQQDINDLIDF